MMTENSIRNCVVCKVDKPATHEFFYKDKNRPLGLMYRCKECDRKRTDNRTSKDRKDKETEDQRKRRLERVSKYNKSEKGKSIGLTYRYKTFDIERGYENNVDYKYLREIRGKPCTYCTFPSTGLDRIDNKKGHTIENTVPCCMECNVARMDNFSHEEMKIIGLSIKKVKSLRL